MKATAARLLLALLFLGTASPARAGDDDIDVRLHQLESADYEVQGLFAVDASSPVVWGVLTDYERIPDFVSSMRRSKVVDVRPDGAEVVEQEGVGGFIVSKAFRVLLEVRREPDSLAFRDLSGTDFKSYSGAWKTQPTEGGTLVIYRLSARPNFAVPGLFLRPAMRRGARALLRAVREEIERRAGRSPGLSVATH